MVRTSFPTTIDSRRRFIVDSYFLDSTYAVVTTAKELILLEDLETQVERILDTEVDDFATSSKHQQLKHFRDCRYQPVHGKNNIIVHGCKNDIRIYDRRMPLKSFSTIKLSDKSIPTSVHLDEQYVTCSLINQQSVISLFDIRNHINGRLATGYTESKAIRYVRYESYGMTRSPL